MWKHHLPLAVSFLLLVWVGFADSRSNQLQYLMNLSMKEWDSKVLIQACSESKNVENCVKFGGAIRAQEWGYGTKHPFWMLRQPSRYKGEVKEKTTSEYVELRVWSFNRHWWRHNTPEAYITRSHYCMSGCDHRVPNVTRFIAGYESWIIPQVDQETIWTAKDEPTETVALWDPIQEGCKRVATAKEWERVQIDKHNLSWFIKVLREWIVGKEERIMIFICDK